MPYMEDDSQDLVSSLDEDSPNLMDTAMPGSPFSTLAVNRKVKALSLSHSSHGVTSNFIQPVCMTTPRGENKKEENTMGPNWLELPRDITRNILQRLGIVEIVTSACHVCPLWWNICKDPLIWRTIYMRDNDRYTYNNMDLAKICRYAVERSCGHLEDIEIVSFCTDDLLQTIASCGSHLRRIRLTKCRNISHRQFSEVANKFPLLEELDISFSNLSNDSLEVIGRSCPLLKSLKFSRMFFRFIMWNEDAFAIAKTMPKLRHLSMIGNLLTNVGLQDILDGCPLLESLDLRKCFHLDLSASLGESCRDQIKDLVLPTDADEDCEDENEDYYFYFQSITKIEMGEFD